MRRRRDRNRQNWWQAIKWLSIAGIFVAIGFAAHQTGTQLARADVERLSQRLLRSEANLRDLEQRNERLQSELNAARAAQAALQRRYDTEVPRGPVADLMAQLRGRMEAGLTTQRLAQVLDHAGAVERCGGPAVSRRFRIGIGPRGADDDTTTFAEGMIRVSAQAPVTAADPAQAAEVTIAGLGVAGGSRMRTGMPLEELLVLGNSELRLSVAPSGVPGFATASLTTCRPG